MKVKLEKLLEIKDVLDEVYDTFKLNNIPNLAPWSVVDILGSHVDELLASDCTPSKVDLYIGEGQVTDMCTDLIRLLFPFSEYVDSVKLPLLEDEVTDINGIDYPNSKMKTIEEVRTTLADDFDKVVRYENLEVNRKLAENYMDYIHVAQEHTWHIGTRFNKLKYMVYYPTKNYGVWKRDKCRFNGTIDIALKKLKIWKDEE